MLGVYEKIINFCKGGFGAMWVEKRSLNKKIF